MERTPIVYQQCVYDIPMSSSAPSEESPGESPLRPTENTPSRKPTPRRPSSRKRRDRSGDPFVAIVRALQRGNVGAGRLCNCRNDRTHVCDCIWKLALKQLTDTDADPEDHDSFHESAPVEHPTDARHGTTAREDAIWERVKRGQNVYHPDDRPLDNNHILGTDVIGSEEDGETW